MIDVARVLRIPGYGNWKRGGTRRCRSSLRTCPCPRRSRRQPRPPGARRRTGPPARCDALRLPPPEDRLWHPERGFLATARGLDPGLLDRCRDDGILYADSRRNAVFLCRDHHQNPVSAELFGTRPFKGVAPGSRKARGGFWLPAPTDDLDAVLLVERAVNALSTLPRWLHAFPAPRTLCAYDVDPAAALRRHTPNRSRLRPAGAKDWNDLLRRATPR